MRALVTHPAARGLADDVALLGDLVLTHDTIVEGVHYRPGDPPESVGWKLAAVNLSDLAAKGAIPAAALLSLTLASSSDGDWEAHFLDGLAEACAAYGLPLVGGDTVALPPGAPRVLGLTAIGRSGPRTPSRSGGCPGDRLWLVGTLGDSGTGLAQLTANPDATGALVEAYRRPVPMLAAGQALAPHTSAMMDVSDGLLLDLDRLCRASGCGAVIDLADLPLSPAFLGVRGDDRDQRLFAATAGDDYALLLALPAAIDPLSLSLPSEAKIIPIGALVPGDRVSLSHHGVPCPLPERLGHEHRTEPIA